MSLNKIKLIDLTHTLSNEIPHWSGQCGFQHQLHHDYEACTSDTKFRVNELQMFSGIGTHIDAPLHCFSTGKSISDLSLEQLFVPCVVIDIPANSPEDYTLLPEDIIYSEKSISKIEKGCFAIIRTGWGKYWNNPNKYRNGLVFPTISSNAAEMLLEREIVGLGIDTLSPDNPKNDFPVHKIILSNGKYIIENLANTELLPSIGSIICAMPIKIKEGTEAPSRVIGIILK